MRYIDINQVLAQIPAEVKSELNKKHSVLVAGNDKKKQQIINRGNITWRRVKNTLEQANNRKCWYTESKNPGCLNDVEHFRPKAKVENNGSIDYWYWFLAFDPENYRLSCQFSNRLNTNPDSGLTGGKGNRFPLMHGQTHATDKAGIMMENSVLLDPCNRGDCDLLEFQPDGMPVVSANHMSDPDACYRVEQSNLFLGLDLPTFKEDREALYNKIKNLVNRGDKYGPDNPALEDVKRDLKELMQSSSAYSKAAECYIRCFRDRVWVEQLLV
jgi:hypothetical protein